MCSYIYCVKALKTVGIRKLKNELSAYLREVKKGTVILVTDRGSIVAELRRPEKDYVQLTRERLKQEWVDSGKLLLPQDVKRTFTSSPVSLPDGTAQLILRIDRQDTR